MWSYRDILLDFLFFLIQNDTSSYEQLSRIPPSFLAIISRDADDSVSRHLIHDPNAIFSSVEFLKSTADYIWPYVVKLYNLSLTRSLYVSAVFWGFYLNKGIICYGLNIQIFWFLFIRPQNCAASLGSINKKKNNVTFSF